MSILASEIKFYRSVAVNDTTSNGGRMSSNEIVDNVKNNLFPDVPQAERTAGSTKYRKAFIKFANDDDLEAIDPKVFVETFTPAQDKITIFPGTFIDTQNDITGSERQYGCGQLNANVSAAATEIQVLTEGAALNCFQDGDTIRISDKPNVSSPTGNEEYAVISGAPSYVGDVATITLAAGLVNGYSASNTRVASCIEADDTAGSYTDPVVGSSAGTFDDETYPSVIDSVGGVTQNWTITFTSATAFNLVGDILGSMGGGTISSDFAPNNSTFSKPYFTLNHLAWGGTWANGDTLTFTTHPAAIPIWYKRTVPASCPSLSGNKVIVGVDCESA
jgi:hypothetical protein